MATKKVKKVKKVVKAAKEKTASNLGPKIVAMVKAEKTWAEICKATGLNQGQALWEYTVATEKKIAIKDEKDLAKHVVNLRNKEKLAWYIIAARVGVGQGKVKAVYEEATGKDHTTADIGKGGRPVSNGSKKSKKAATKAVKSAKPVAEAKGFTKKLAAMDDAGVEKALTGKSIVVNKDGKKYPLKVVKVRKVKGEGADRLVAFSDADNKERIVRLANIAR